MGNRKDLELVSETLASAVERENADARLQHGAQLRAAMHQALAAKQPFDHYRLKWLSDAIDEVVLFVRGQCKKFDAEHPDDMASAGDMLDILSSAANLIRSSMPKKG